MTRAALNGENVFSAGVEDVAGGLIMASVIGGASASQARPAGKSVRLI